MRKGALVLTCSAQVEFPNAFEKSKVRSCKQEGIIIIQAWKLKFFIAEDQTSLVQSNRKACLAQTEDE
jgi:hypothetical protein